MCFIWFSHALKNRSITLHIGTRQVVPPRFQRFAHTWGVEGVWSGLLVGSFR